MLYCIFNFIISSGLFLALTTLLWMEKMNYDKWYFTEFSTARARKLHSIKLWMFWEFIGLIMVSTLLVSSGMDVIHYYW